MGDAVGYSIVEFNASDTRSKKSLDVSLGDEEEYWKEEGVLRWSNLI